MYIPPITSDRLFLIMFYKQSICESIIDNGATYAVFISLRFFISLSLYVLIDDLRPSASYFNFAIYPFLYSRIAFSAAFYSFATAMSGSDRPYLTVKKTINRSKSKEKHIKHNKFLLLFLIFCLASVSLYSIIPISINFLFACSYSTVL